MTDETEVVRGCLWFVAGFCLVVGIGSLLLLQDTAVGVPVTGTAVAALVGLGATRPSGTSGT